MYAAIGTDGQRLVVWGLGETVEAAEADACAQEGYDESSIHNSIVECTQAAAELVRTGVVALEGSTPLSYQAPTRSDLARVSLRSEAR